MATFQAPAPRRSSRLGSRPPGYSPPVVQPRRQRQLANPSTGQSSRLPTSRLTTPVRNTALNRIPDDISVTSDGAVGMDVDEEAASLIFERAIRTETVFAKSQQLAVSFYSNLPVEVKQILKNSGESLSHSLTGCGPQPSTAALLPDFYRDSYGGDVDPLTGFALVASAQTCFVWNHAQVRTHSFRLSKALVLTVN
jgi:nuclear pore complex protein Nup133